MVKNLGLEFWCGRAFRVGSFVVVVIKLGVFVVGPKCGRVFGVDQLFIIMHKGSLLW